MIEKVKEEDRTFETRLLFLKDVFQYPFTQEELMAKCIEAKLNKSILDYEKELEKHIIDLEGKRVLKVANKMKNRRML